MINTSSVHLGSRLNSGIYTVNTRFGIDEGSVGAAQKITPSFYQAVPIPYFGTVCTIANDGNMGFTVVGGNFYKAYTIFKVIVNSGSYPGGNIDCEVTCVSGSDPPENIGVSSSDPLEFGGPTPTLSDIVSPVGQSMYIGETKWLNGTGALALVDGYFSIEVYGGWNKGESSNASYQVNKIRWNLEIIWEYGNSGIRTSGVRL